MKRTLFALLASAAIAACGGGGGGDPDAGDDGDDGDDTPDADRTPDAEQVIPYPLTDVLQLQAGLAISDMAPELQTSAVLPDTEYLVWVAAYLENGVGDPPPAKDYEISICPSTFTAPTPPPACAFTEADDLNNATMPEASGQTVGAMAFDICGVLNANMPDGQNVVDRDQFTFTTMGAATQVEFRLTSANPQPGTVMLVQVAGAGCGGTCGEGLFLGSHGVASIIVPAGDYTAHAVSLAAAMPAANSDYRITVSTGNLDTRCTTITGTAAYTERSDGAMNDGNDVISLDFGGNPPLTLTASTTDNPERTNLTVAANTKLAGSLPVRTPLDSYTDKDTFLIRTGPAVNQIDVRIDWPGADGDLDYFVFIPVQQ